MIVSGNSSSAQTPNTPDDYPVHIDGHMANDTGNTSGIEPHATLSANADEIWLKGDLGDFHIPRSAVKKIGRGGMYPWFFMAVRIRHSIPNFPSILQFQALNAKSCDIIAQFKHLGYPTS